MRLDSPPYLAAPHETGYISTHDMLNDGGVETCPSYDAPFEFPMRILNLRPSGAQSHEVSREDVIGWLTADIGVP